MHLILIFVKMADDGQWTETCRQNNNKIKYVVVFETRNYFVVF